MWPALCNAKLFEFSDSRLHGRYLGLMRTLHDAESGICCPAIRLGLSQLSHQRLVVGRQHFALLVVFLVGLRCVQLARKISLRLHLVRLATLGLRLYRMLHSRVGLGVDRHSCCHFDAFDYGVASLIHPKAAIASEMMLSNGAAANLSRSCTLEGLKVGDRPKDHMHSLAASDATTILIAGAVHDPRYFLLACLPQ